jgi:hypothetical protein
MRWFIEVTPLGTASPAGRFCVEATRWQAALQAVRRARDEQGAFANFYIELVEQGYRALHPESRTRYMVTRAPDDAAVTPGLTAIYESLPPTEPPPTRAPSVRPVPSRPLAQGFTPHAGNGKGPSSAAFSSERPTQPSAGQSAGGREVSFEVLKTREEEPTQNVPMLYREHAYLVPTGTDLDAVGRLIWDRFREVVEAIEHRPKGKFIQIAVFDHRFDDRPERPPLGTLLWKDWRGDPALHFPGDPKRDVVRAWPENGDARLTTPSEYPAPTPSADAPVSPAKPATAQEPVGLAKPATAQEPIAPEPLTPAPVGLAAPHLIQVVEARPIAPAPIVQAQAPIATPPVGLAQPATAQEPVPGRPPPAADWPARAPAMPAADLPVDDGPATLPIANSGAVAARVHRRTEGEDLIGELFESMHDLNFVQDVVSGAEFVLRILARTLPAELIVIHVFDIDSAHFVVVRAHGEGSRSLLLHRTPDSDPLFDRVMRRERALHLPDAASDPGYQGGRWSKVAVSPRVALCGGAKLGGRYLGAVELVNPPGGEPFHTSEINALDYICEQFAEFLAARPIVIDAEVVMPNQSA